MAWRSPAPDLTGWIKKNKHHRDSSRIPVFLYPVPAEFLEIHHTFEIKDNAFIFKERALNMGSHAESVGADFAFGVDHPLPGHVQVIFLISEGSQCEPHHLRRTAPDDARDLPVSGYLAGRDLAHGRIDHI